MRFLSVCSGIEAATVASAHLGWQAAGYAEIDPFCCSLLKEKYPNVPNYGDFTTIRGDELGPVDAIVGGTPCQDFSVAGKRAGLDGARGNLTLEFVRLVERVRPRWVFWENVPGVLSIDGGRAFGALLGGLAELGVGFAYRILDAQYFGVPQRRRRVFVVGCARGWQPAAAVLFEREAASSRGASCVTAGASVAATLSTRVHGGSLDQFDQVAATLSAWGQHGTTLEQFDQWKSAGRLYTPRECERLNGFPDDYTLIQYKGKPASDAPRYHALGNSWAVPCVRWIFERMEAVDAALSAPR